MFHKWMTVLLPPSCEHTPRAWWAPGGASAAGDASTGGLFLGGHHIPGVPRADGKNNRHGCSLREPAALQALRGLWGEPRPPETEEIK